MSSMDYFPCTTINVLGYFEGIRNLLVNGIEYRVCSNVGIDIGYFLQVLTLEKQRLQMNNSFSIEKNTKILKERYNRVSLYVN